MTELINWLTKKSNQSNSSPPQYDTGRLYMAQLAKEEAEQDHKDAMEVIEALEEEGRKNNYTKMIESAIRHSRKDKPL